MTSRQRGPWQLPDVALPAKLDAGHEAPDRRKLREQIVQACDRAEPVAHAHVTRRDPSNRCLADAVIRFRPRGEPAVDRTGGAAVDLVGDDVGEQGELIPPALQVFVAHRWLGERVRQAESVPSRCYSRMMVTSEPPGGTGVPLA